VSIFVAVDLYPQHNGLSYLCSFVSHSVVGEYTYLEYWSQIIKQH